MLYLIVCMVTVICKRVTVLLALIYRDKKVLI